MTDEILICACSSDEHQIVIHKDEEDKLIYCSIHLVTLPFWQRLLSAIKHLFGYKCKYGNFEEIILNHMVIMIKKLKLKIVLLQMKRLQKVFPLIKLM